MIPLSLVLVVASAATLSWGIAASSRQLVWVSLLAALAAVALVATTVVRLRRRLAVGNHGPPSLAPPAPPAPRSEGSSAGSGASGTAVPPPAGWPWSAEVPAGGGTAPPRSGWTGPVAAGPAETPEAQSAVEQSAASPPARPGFGWWTGAPPAEPASPGQAVGADRPAEPAQPAQPLRSRAGEAAGAALGAAADRPLGEPFPTGDGEPPVEDVPVRDALRVAQLDDAVQVVDGHPRYHLTGCPALAGAEPVPLPASAARRAGFTPCAICGPDRTLLARASDRRSQTPDATSD